MSVNSRLVNPLTTQLFEAILLLENVMNAMNSLKISAQLMNCMICPSVCR